MSRTAQIMKDMLDSVDTLGDFVKSDIYAHLNFKPVNADFARQVRADLISSFQDEAFSYMRGNEFWEELKALT